MSEFELPSWATEEMVQRYMERDKRELVELYMGSVDDYSTQIEKLEEERDKLKLRNGYWKEKMGNFDCKYEEEKRGRAKAETEVWRLTRLLKAHLEYTEGKLNE